MSIVILYLVTFAVFLGLDYLGLSYLIKPTFERDIGPLLLDSPRIGPAFVFYAFYIGCVLWFVSWPAVQDGHALIRVFGAAALIGAMGYGTYEFTNLATLKDWTWRMVAVDLTWGTLLTAVSACAGVLAVRALA